MKSKVKEATRRISMSVVALGLVMGAQVLAAASSRAGAASSGGVLTVGYDLTGSSVPVEFDPVKFTVASGNLGYDLPIYGGLLRETPSGTFVPDLASKVTVVNPSTINVTVRPGEVFSDGTPFTAAAVKAGLERNITTTNKSGFNTSLYDISSIDVTGTDSLVLNFSQPVANTFYPLLANQEAFIVSPTAAAAGTLGTDPVGAGPFMFKSYTTAEKLVLVKNPKYWDAKNIHLSGITFVSVPAGPQQVSALESGEVNALDSLPPSDIPVLKDQSSATGHVLVPRRGYVLGPDVQILGTLGQGRRAPSVERRDQPSGDQQIRSSTARVSQPGRCSRRPSRSTTKASPGTTPTTRPRQRSCSQRPVTRTGSPPPSCRCPSRPPIRLRQSSNRSGSRSASRCRSSSQPTS